MSSIIKKIRRNLRRSEVDRMYSTESDSMGNSHVVAYQRRLMSCGIACCAMVVQRVRGMLLEESLLRSYSQCFYQGPDTGSAAYSTFSGTESYNLAIMLKKMCVPVSTEAKSGRAIINLGRATSNTPVIALINWDTKKGAGQGGGHFIVVDSCDDGGNAVICDPWYGLVECDVSSGRYSAKNDTGRFADAWVFTDA